MEESNKTISVGLVGLGTVGGEVFRRLVEHRDRLTTRSGADVEVTAVADLRIPDDLEDLVSTVSYYEDAVEMMETESLDLLVELIGGISPASEIVRHALNSGLDVVTANKELLAKEGPEIYELADETGNRIRFEASVGGSIPIVRTLREAFIDTDIHGVYGIINGTANYVLTRMELDDQPFGRALETAQEKGYAEADPSYDVEGDDSAHKLTVLTTLAFGSHVSLEEIYCEGITSISPDIVHDAQNLGYRIKLLGIVKRRNDQLEIRVHPTMIPIDSALAAVRNEYNAVEVKADPLGSSMLYGKGAGGAPTASAVISDVVDLAIRDDRVQSALDFAPGLELCPIEEIETRYYLRLMAEDHPGVLASVTKILGDHRISIDSVIQHGRSRDQQVPVILTTHRAREGNLRQAVKEISDLTDVQNDPVVLRIEEELSDS